MLTDILPAKYYGIYHYGVGACEMKTPELNKQNLDECLQFAALALRAFCLFFLPYSVDKLTQTSSAKDELNLSEQYACLWAKSVELVPPFRRILVRARGAGCHHEHKCAVQHTQHSWSLLTFIAAVCFTEILKACQYSVLDRARFTEITDLIKEHTTSVLPLCVFFYNKKRNKLCTSYA